MSIESLILKITGTKHSPSNEVIEAVQSSRTPIGRYTSGAFDRRYVPLNKFIQEKIKAGAMPANAKDLVLAVSAMQPFEGSLAAFIPDEKFTNGVRPDQFVLYTSKKGGGELAIVGRDVLVKDNRPRLLFRTPEQKNEQ